MMRPDAARDAEAGHARRLARLRHGRVAARPRVHDGRAGQDRSAATRRARSSTGSCRRASRGKWLWQTAAEGGAPRAFELALNQNFQKVEGTLTVDGKTVPIEDAKLVGDRLTFVAKLDGGARATNSTAASSTTRSTAPCARSRAGARRARAAVERRAHRSVGAAALHAAAADAHPAAVTRSDARAAAPLPRRSRCCACARAPSRRAATLDIPTPYVPSTQLQRRRDAAARGRAPGRRRLRPRLGRRAHRRSPPPATGARAASASSSTASSSPKAASTRSAKASRTA